MDNPLRVLLGDGLRCGCGGVLPLLDWWAHPPSPYSRGFPLLQRNYDVGDDVVGDKWRLSTRDRSAWEKDIRGSVLLTQVLKVK